MVLKAVWKINQTLPVVLMWNVTVYSNKKKIINWGNSFCEYNHYFFRCFSITTFWLNLKAFSCLLAWEWYMLRGCLSTLASGLTDIRGYRMSTAVYTYHLFSNWWATLVSQSHWIYCMCMLNQCVPLYRTLYWCYCAIVLMSYYSSKVNFTALSGLCWMQ